VAILIDVGASTVTSEGTTTELSDRELAVLVTLSRGTVVSRADLIRDAGLADLSPRRCEGIILSLRRILGPDSILNLRRRGWRLAVEVATSTADPIR
jgi:DNA-binding winged helix-turn-helix (wHTH) protein